MSGSKGKKLMMVIFAIVGFGGIYFALVFVGAYFRRPINWGPMDTMAADLSESLNDYYKKHLYYPSKTEFINSEESTYDLYHIDNRKRQVYWGFIEFDEKNDVIDKREMCAFYIISNLNHSKENVIIIKLVKGELAKIYRNNLKAPIKKWPDQREIKEGNWE